MTIFVLLPAYNEAENLKYLINSLRFVLKKTSLPFKIVIVDDGSTDETGKLREKYHHNSEIQFVKHKVNKGLGAAMDTGFKTIIKKAGKDDLLIAMDADNTMEVSAIAKILTKFNQGYDLILASRFQPGGGDQGISFIRRLMSHQAGRIFQIIFPIKGVREYTCSYRGYRVGLLKQAYAHYRSRFIREKGFNCMLEILMKLSRFSPKIIEVSFILYYNRKKGTSKMDVKNTLWRYFNIIINRRSFLK